MIRNGTFTGGWRDLRAGPGYLVNQQPAGWRLAWIEPGRPLYDDPQFRAGGIPECVHKLASQLPPNEQLGAPDALILAGNVTYKIFHAHASFGATLSQTVTGLRPGGYARLTVPIQAHFRDDPDPYTLESGVWVDGEGRWAAAGEMGHRRWYYHRVEFTVPPDGRADVTIRVKSKWGGPKDFFIDAVTLEAETADEPESLGHSLEKGSKGLAVPLADPHRVTATAGLNLRHTPDLAHDPIIRLPEGTRINVESSDGGWARISAYVSTDWISPEAPPRPAQPPHRERRQPSGREEGIDVSHWQGRIDWDRVRARGVTFAYIKATEGNTIVDEQYERNWREAGRVGIRRGAYHYYRNNVAPEAQAAFFAEHAHAGELPPAGDFEDHRDGRGDLAGDIQRFMEAVEARFGHTPVVYTRASWWDERVGHAPWAGRHRLWVAHYSGANDGTPPPPAFRPALPRGWTAHWIWQWTDHGPGQTYGVESEGLDIDWMIGELN